LVVKKKSKDISAEEQHLWETFLKESKVLASPNTTKPKAGQNLNFYRNDQSSNNKDHSKATGKFAKQNHNTNILDKKVLGKLKNGRVRPERILDLHGFTYDQAFKKVNQMVYSSFNDGIRLILVITGKGRKLDPYKSFFEDRPTGLLKESLPLWLENPGIKCLILSVMTAHGSHGGSGAFYIYLKKNTAITKHNAQHQ
jgi:DNA-nicking Smr family endonuclease